MHSILRKELKKAFSTDKSVKLIAEEWQVKLNKKQFGSFDFFVKFIDNKTIGFEVLGRPSLNKLKAKLKYLPFVDKYVFVLPSDSFSFYRKPTQKIFFKEFIPKSFPLIFSNKKIFVWLLDLKNKEVIKKELFSRIFNVSKKI